MANHTYHDESYRRGAGPKPYIHAPFPGDAELSWLEEVAQRACHLNPRKYPPGCEMKHEAVRSVLRSCDRDLAGRIERGVAQAVIIIVDERPFRTEIQGWWQSSRLGPHLPTISEPIRAKIETLIQNDVNSLLLVHTPLPKVTEFVNGTDGVDAMRTRLGKDHNVRIFAGRVTGAFWEFLDRDKRRRAFMRIIEERRFLFPGDFEAELLAESDLMTRVFDDGHQQSVAAIDELRSSTHEQLVRRGRLWLPATPPVTIERDSRSERLLQASDVASGMARELYESNDGLRRVCDKFKAVVVNGCVQAR